MAKKLPFIISTLTLFASWFVPGATTWADGATYSPDGPWSFKEMMAVETEIQPSINEVCPNDPNLWSCIYRYTEDRAYDESFIYDRVLSFENDQFHILSLDPDFENGKTTIEYYFNSENSFEKYRGALKTEYDYGTGTWRKKFDESLYTHIISKLYIYQVESGYDAAFVDESLYPEMFASPHTRMLYSGVKPESVDSLLPVNQKGTLEIEPISFESKYLNSVYIAFEDEKGRIHSHGVDFSGCHQGGEECKLQYTRQSAWPLLVNKPTYKEGYADGYNAGLAAGQSIGYEKGFEEGYNNGDADGYDTGHADGYDEGHAHGYNSGYDEGRNQGLIQGRMEGYESGHMLGYDEGWTEGYDNGYDDGLNDGYYEGYDNGYNNGYNNGFTNGYNAAKSDNIYEDERNSDSSNNDNTSSSDGDIDEGKSDDRNNDDINISSSDGKNINNGNTTSDILINNTSSTIVGSELVSNMKTRLFAKTPNTGSPTQESSSVEFTWWLGMIFVTGGAALIWLFIPKRKKSKKSLKKS